ncbi:hypothetical protein [Paludisphaera sp.]|uniref:hypothetical protein n=1 Tax=Paludisphaera sp. TaxID=2017432 RepID=UPI00301CF51A
MRARLPSLAIAASILLSVPALGDEPPGAGRRIPVVDSPAILPPGARCRVELHPEARAAAIVEVSYEGKVVSADGEGLTLAVAETRRKDVYHPEAARLPLIGRLFTNVGVTRARPGEEKDVRISAEKIRAVELVRD